MSPRRTDPFRPLGTFGVRLDLAARALLLSAALAALSSPVAATPSDEPKDLLFEQHEIELPRAHQETVLTGCFLGGSARNIAVVSVGNDEIPRLRAYSLETGSWIVSLEVALAAGTAFIDTIEIGDRERLITYGEGRLHWVDPDTGSERLLAELATTFRTTDGAPLPRVDITRDLNLDGREDLLVPDLDGFWLSLQTRDGSLTRPVKLGPREPFLDQVAVDDKRPYREVGITARTAPWYQSRVHQLDHDLDGRSDLVFWDEDHFVVYYQDVEGGFLAEPGTFTTEVPFEADGDYSLAFGLSDKSTFALMTGLKKKTTRTVLHALSDWNGDDIPDLVTWRLEGRSLIRQRSLYEVHFGERTPEGIHFSRAVGASIEPKWRAGGLQFAGYSSQHERDLDGDGRSELVFGDVNIGLGGMLRALVANSVSLNLEFHRLDGGAHSGQPAAVHKVKPDLHIFARKRGPFFPPVLLGDVDGDGREDLLVGKDWEELEVYFGAPGASLFEARPQRLDVAALPGDERNTRLVDLDRDGRQDILMHHPSDRGVGRITLLMAR